MKMMTSSAAPKGIGKVLGIVDDYLAPILTGPELRPMEL